MLRERTPKKTTHKNRPFLGVDKDLTMAIQKSAKQKVVKVFIIKDKNGEFLQGSPNIKFLESLCHPELGEKIVPAEITIKEVSR